MRGSHDGRSGMGAREFYKNRQEPWGPQWKQDQNGHLVAAARQGLQLTPKEAWCTGERAGATYGCSTPASPVLSKNIH